MAALRSVLARFPDARQCKHGHLALCPAHDDRSPSLSIQEGRDGRVLLYCFAGCGVEKVVRAAGLSVTDLFATPHESRRPRADGPRALTLSVIDAALRRERLREHQAEAERLGFEPPMLAIYENAARRAVERRFNLRLPRVPVPWDEILPNAVDPAWAVCVEMATIRRAATCNVPVGWLASVVSSLPVTACAILNDAADILHEVTRREMLVASSA